MGDFSERVYRAVRQVPRGKVASYGQIARLMGAPRSARYVGYALRANPHPGNGAQSVPCHRIVFKDGGLCRGYAFGGPGVQREMLEEEGVVFADAEHVDMAACQWDGRPEEGTGETPGEMGASPEQDLPLSPPPDFDWKRELGDQPGK